MARFDGKVVLITGGTRGIGLACALRFVSEGARVAVLGRDEARLAAVAPLLEGGLALSCDVRLHDEVVAAVKTVEEQLGAVGILVNNAGITRDGLLMRMKEEDLDAVIDTSVRGAFLCTQAVARAMQRQRWGRVINISSVVGLHGQAGQTNYATAKAGLIGFTKAYAREAASRNITVNAVAPGLIGTDMTAGMDEKAVAEAIARIPLQRTGLPEEVAAAVAFLASDEAAYITGAVIPVDGGLGM
jgi:3-oxoacyl-[acyl-carrier protein] reductase